MKSTVAANTTPTNMKRTQYIQRHPIVSPMKPPINGPMHGPMKMDDENTYGFGAKSADRLGQFHAYRHRSTTILHVPAGDIIN
jgi:hypothetical protein